MTEFTPLASLLGGILIGLSAVLLMAFDGRIAGISGIAGRVLPPYLTDTASPQALAFIAGLIAAPFLVGAVTGGPVVQAISGNVPLMAIAGVLVGFGAGYGGGCTSGHGVCGMARFSTRSIIATAAFMLTALVTVYLTRHVWGA